MKELLAQSGAPLTIDSTCVAVALCSAFAQVPPGPLFTLRSNSSVRVTVRPGLRPRVGGSLIVTVDAVSHAVGRLFQGLKVGDVGTSRNMSVHVFAVMPEV